MTLLFTVGCQKQEKNVLQKTTLELLQSDKSISDEDFYSALSGRTQVPRISISEKVKRKILFEDMGLDISTINILQPKLTEANVKSYEAITDYLIVLPKEKEGN